MDSLFKIEPSQVMSTKGQMMRFDILFHWLENPDKYKNEFEASVGYIEAVFKNTKEKP